MALPPWRQASRPPRQRPLEEEEYQGEDVKEEDAAEAEDQGEFKKEITEENLQQNIIMAPRVGRGCNLPPKVVLDCPNPNCSPCDFEEEPFRPKNDDDGDCSRLLKLHRMSRTGTVHERTRTTSMFEAGKRKLEARAQDTEVSEPTQKRARQTLERLAAAVSDGGADRHQHITCRRLAVSTMLTCGGTARDGLLDPSVHIDQAAEQSIGPLEACRTLG